MPAVQHEGQATGVSNPDSSPPGLKALRHPFGVAALAGAALFFWAGVFEAVYLLFFQGAMIQVAAMADWVKMFASLDTGLLLRAGLVYALPGLALGAAWWALVSTGRQVLEGAKHKVLGKRADSFDLFFFVGAVLLILTIVGAVSTLIKKPSVAPLLTDLVILGLLAIATFTRTRRQARDFFDHISYVGLSLLFLLVFFLLLAVGTKLNPAAAGLPLPVRALIAALACYVPFKACRWLTDKFLSLPVVRVLRRPVTQAVLALLTVLALTVFAVVPGLLAPQVAVPAAERIFTPEKNPPIVFVVLDTCRADHFGVYGYPRPTTPNFDALAREGILFRNTISESPWTLPSHASMFTGLFPRSHGASISHFRLDGRFFTLAEFLRACGYYTLGLSANTMVGRVTGLDQGFDRFEEVWRTEGRDKLSLMRALRWLGSGYTDKGARRINELVDDWLEQGGAADRPFFLFINYLEVHGPYSPPKPFRDRFLNPNREGKPPAEVNIYDDRFVKYFTGQLELTDLELDDLRSMYDAELAYLDSRLGELRDILKKHGVLDRALLIVLGDHGENLGEHRLTDHQLCVYDTLLRVPFLIRAPSLLPAGKEVGETVQHNSIFPTIAGLLGIPVDRLPADFQAASLLPVILQDNPGVKVAFSEYGRPSEILKILKFKAPGFDVSFLDRDLISGREDRAKYVFTSNDTDELYDLREDGAEEDNLCRQGRCDARHPLRAAIEQWLRETPAYEAEAEAPSIAEQADREALEKLRSLGYVQ